MSSTPTKDIHDDTNLEGFDKSEVTLIDHLCDRILTGYTINKELLMKWQVELADTSHDSTELSTIIEEELVISYPIETTDFSVKSRDIEYFFENLNNLDEEVHHDFKIILLELFLYSVSLSYTIKILMYRQNVHKLIAANFLELVSTVELDSSFDCNVPLIVSQHGRLIIIFSEFGCDIDLLRKLMMPLYNEKINHCIKLVLLDLLNQLFTSYPCHFDFFVLNDFQNSAVTIPFINDLNSLKCLTIQSFFKINSSCIENKFDDGSSTVTLFLLANSSGSNSSTLKIQLVNNNQFMIEIKNHQNGSRMQFSFNQILDLPNHNNQSYTHFALTYDSYTNLNLFINGEYSESIPCPELYKILNSWNKVYIGDERRTLSHNNDELLIRNLTVLNVALSYEWVHFLYNLGLGYDWDFKDFSEDRLLSLLNHLSYRGLINVSLKIKELQSNHTRENSDVLNHMRQGKHQFEMNKNLTNGTTNNAIDRKSIAKVLILSRFKESNVLFDSNASSFMDSLEAPCSPKILIHKSNSIHSALYSIGGSSLLLKLIEYSSQISTSRDKKIIDTLLYKSLTLLFSILNNNWRLSKEFENINGYGLLLILLMRYKENINSSLEFNLVPGFDSSKSPETDFQKQDLLKVILVHSGYNFINPYESIIINPIAYRFLILNFDLYYGSNVFELLLYHFRVLISESKYSYINAFELNKMKLLRKVLQFFKSPFLSSETQETNIVHELSNTFDSILKADTSVETIRTISLFVIYLLYQNPHIYSERISVLALKSLTKILCDSNLSIKVLKKFSRSITIHWILLLLKYKSTNDSKYSKEIVHCGIRLLTRLLKILGPHIIKRFFHVNHGLDILSSFLKDWWKDDEMLCLIYLASFGIDLRDVDKSSLTLTEVFANENYISRLNQLVMPEFLILLNNLVLNSMNDLSIKKGKSLSAPSSPLKSKRSDYDDNDLEISYDVLHLINQYTESINFGIENVKPLSNYYNKKEWLEGAFELLGHLKLSLSWINFELLPNFQSTYEKLAKVLSSLFVAKLLKSSEFFDIFNGLSDFTKKLILDIIFPRIFEHVNQFVDISNFIFQEKEFLEGTIDILNYYYSAFIDQNYVVGKNDIDKFLTCVISIIETNESSKSTNKPYIGMKNLKKYLGEVIVIKLIKISDDDEQHNKKERGNIGQTLKFESQSETQSSELDHKLGDFVKWLLYRQMTILRREVLDEERMSQLVSLLLGSFFKLSTEEQSQKAEYIFNFLRSCYMMQSEDFHKTISLISKGSDYNESEILITEFFDNLLTKNDDETLRNLQKYPTFKHIFTKSYHVCIGKYGERATLNVTDMAAVTLNNGGSLGLMNNVYINNFEKDCEQLRLSMVNGELIKFSRAEQDKQENMQYFVTTYNSLKIEVARLINQEDIFNKKSQYILDFIENVDRMRRRMIVQNQLSESEKLSYNINIPIKLVETINNEFPSLKDFNYSMTNSDMDGILDTTDDNDSYEVIDDASDMTESEGNSFEDRNRKVIRSLYMGDQIVALWNISQINGLAPIESLMILGTNHLYLIENYLHCANGNVIDAHDAPIELRDPYLQLVNSQSRNYLKSENGRSHRTKSWGLDKLSCISKRQFLLRDIAIEMFFSDGASILITCLSTKERDSIYSKLFAYASGKGLDNDLLQALQLSSSISTRHPLTDGTSFFTSKLASAFTSGSTSSLLAATKKWKRGEMSNFYYLIIINTLAGRTYNDLTQYPVFPWVIADYTSETLDLSNPKTFRDLSKPMGAQTMGRANEFRERYEALDSLHDNNAPPFHYGTHYSSAMIVTSFLIRLKPYVQSYLLLQGGKFDHADRLFNSVEKAWNSASRDNTTDVRELTPEFFYLPEFLTNSSNFEFGTLQNGQASNDVSLPPWAKGDPKLFIAKNREALESSYVSANLHLWIELIFGHKQSGQEAVNSLNVFHHLSYNGAINLDKINDEVEKRAIIGMINNFGQTPLKIFQKAHPIKEVLNLPNYYMSLINTNTEPRLIFSSKLKAPIKKLELTLRKWLGRPSCVSNEDDLLIRKTNLFKGNCKSLIINQTTFLNIHLSNITCILPIGHKSFLTASEDGIINVWKCALKPSMNLQFQCLLRGHFTGISSLIFSSSFKTGISVDIDGMIIIWDFTRFKFVRKIMPPSAFKTPLRVLTSISNDTGNIIAIYSSERKNLLMIFTINGEIILSKHLDHGVISSVTCGSINDPMVDTDKYLVTNSHIYWSNELIAIAYNAPKRLVNIYELKEDEGNECWALVLIDAVDFGSTSVGEITAMELFKQSEIDTEDKLCRGLLKLVVGDSFGKVYSW
ncbi:uncharacterized protein AC631_02042 [Debaryomyces fabryi]|uniref:Beach-domain-containing protein n=1 Tax=Debaryomyces fabryi TaxID=58627 RepID=A0A0V1Q171_9ASCO|nr:uncharacterized protein AC631_02042 [Debaryomyces fabryi]KSA02224.1 hypothetical protein AC631_02042 [Debaryomyces fabryi]CUM46590.1 unnamed protein product [Debaryomyces fabryi]